MDVSASGLNLGFQHRTELVQINNHYKAKFLTARVYLDGSRLLHSRFPLATARAGNWSL